MLILCIAFFFVFNYIARDIWNNNLVTFRWLCLELGIKETICFRPIIPVNLDYNMVRLSQICTYIANENAEITLRSLINI